QAQPWDPLFIIGRPITEPYWTLVRLRGEVRWVLVQAFERRLLTYTPENPEGWRVEMGNVGRHYYEWRYGTPPSN
ncbi:MAG: CAP domain-containing protein, partial [Thermomicrobium sp.]